MKEVINGHEFEFYDSISVMPVYVFHAYSRYMLVVSGIGDTLQDIDERIGNVAKLMTIDLQRAQQELLNLRQCLFMVANERDVRHKGFLALTKSLDGKPWEDYTEKGIDKLYEIANADTVEHLTNVFEPIIKGINEELRRYFPEFFENSVEKNECELLRKRALLQCDYIVNGVNHDVEIEDINKKLTHLIRPQNFENDTAIIQFDKQFEEMCLILSKEYGNAIKEKSVMEYYTAYNLLKKQTDELKKRKTK